nr:hypothetical protein BgiMline_019977 [Biomphalaria glabrata]
MRLLIMFQMIANFILIYLRLTKVVFCQQIQLFPYNETKNCNISLVEEKDRILMYGKVDFNGNTMASSVVNFEIKRKSELNFYFICFLKVPEDCNNNFFEYCSCYRTNDRKVVTVLINITASTANSEAEMRAELVYRETSFYSEIRKLPIVYGSETEAIVLYANDQVVHSKQTNVIINNSQVTIISICLEKFAQHCELHLSNMSTTLVSVKQIVAYNTNFNGTGNFDLKYTICNIPRNISFSITSENEELENSELGSLSTSIKYLLFDIFLFAITLLILHKLNPLIPLSRSRKKICMAIILEKSIKRTDIKPECDNNIEESTEFINENGANENRLSNKTNLTKRKELNHPQRKTSIAIKAVPIHYNDNDFLELIKLLSKLTCGITLKTPWSSKQNLGSGLVTSVVKYFQGVGIDTVKDVFFRKCPCTKCVKSESPKSDAWGEIFIKTSSSILKNKNYHKQIACVLSTSANVTSELRDLTVEHKDPEKTGRCVLKYVTCDQALINNLQGLQTKGLKLEAKVQEAFRIYEKIHKIYVSIVYREDGTKYISSGGWTPKKAKRDVRAYHLNPEIPSGNMGAPLVLLGYCHKDKEYNHQQNKLGDVFYNTSSSVFEINMSNK